MPGESDSGAAGGDSADKARHSPRWETEGDIRPDPARGPAVRGEAFLRVFFESAPVGMALIDFQGRIIDANPALQEMLGFGREELRRMGYAGLVHPDDHKLVRPVLDSLGRGRTRRARLELRYIRNGWSLRWGRVTASLMVALDGGPPLIVAALEDITEHRMTADSLRASLARYRDLVEDAAAGVATVSSDGRLTYVNAEMCRLSGYPEEELLGRHYSDFIVPADLDGLRGRAGAATDDGGGHPPMEFRLVRKDGRTVHCYTSPTVFRDGGMVTAVSAIVQDISARKRNEAELVRLSTAIKLIRESVLIVDPGGRVVFANTAASGLTPGIAHPGGVDGFAGCVLPSGRDKWGLVLAETLRRGMVRDAELELDGGGGRPVPVEVSATALADGEGNPAGIVLILRDITERKLAQRQMRSRLMTFRLEEGEVYLVKESGPVLSMEGFSDLLRAGYRGTVLSRSPPRKPREETDSGFGCLWLSEGDSPGSLPPRPHRILQWVETLPRNHAILVDRLDYIISRSGPRAALELVHRLREAAYLGGHIVIFGLDPATVDSRWLRAFEKEASEVTPRQAFCLPPEQQEIVKHVFQQSIAGRRPTLTEAGRALGFSKPTVRRHVREAVRDGYVALIQRGRTKVLELTEKGRGVFSK